MKGEIPSTYMQKLNSNLDRFTRAFFKSSILELSLQMIAIIILHFKKIIAFFTIYAGFENEGTESSPDQPGMHMPQSSSINSAVPNKTSIRQF